MIARRRGEHDSSSRWRPIIARQSAGETLRQRSPAAEPSRSRRQYSVRPGRLSLLALFVVAVSYAATSWGLAQFADTPPQRRLPATPQAWLDAYEAAAVDNPDRVCTELFSPQLARAYGKTMHGTCRTYFARITSFSVVVRRVFQDGSTTVLALHQTVHPANWVVVLTRHSDGWQAVDLLPGQPLR